MSGVDEPERNNTMMCCAACGIAGVDDIKLKKCTACYLVRYCSIKCQRDHRPQHKKECKKRAAELRDEILFKQPERSHLGECPICCLRLPLGQEKSTMMPCCSKFICNGCEYANSIYELEGCLQRKCPFCRHPVPDSEEETKRNMMKRVEANDPVAMRQMGGMRRREGDYDGAFEYWSEAAGLGDVGAHYQLSVVYREGLGAEKDKKKELHHLEEAAIGGELNARHNLGCVEGNNGRTERAMKHHIIAANMGHDGSLDALKLCYRDGLISKEVFAAALRGHQTAVDAMKSPQRKVAEEALQRMEAEAT